MLIKQKQDTINVLKLILKIGLTSFNPTLIKTAIKAANILDNKEKIIHIIYECIVVANTAKQA